MKRKIIQDKEEGTGNQSWLKDQKLKSWEKLKRRQMIWDDIN